jgi:hypothetical protein
MGYFSGIFIEKGNFSSDPTSLSIAVTEIRPLPVLDNFGDFSSKIIKNRPFWFWSGFSIISRYPDTATFGLGSFL